MDTYQDDYSKEGEQISLYTEYGKNKRVLDYLLVLKIKGDQKHVQVESHEEVNNHQCKRHKEHDVDTERATGLGKQGIVIEAYYSAEDKV